MDRRTVVSIIVAVLVLLAAGIAVWKVAERNSEPPPGENGGTQSGTAPPPVAEKLPSTMPESATKSDVPTGTKVPEPGESAPAGVAVPSIVAPISAGSRFNIRYFDIDINQNKFSSSKIIIYTGDIAQITFRAVDQTYDITQPDNGIKYTIAQGQKKTIQNQFSSPGQYLLYCTACGGPDKGPKGYIIVVPKQ